MFTGIVQEQGEIKKITQMNAKELSLSIHTKTNFFKEIEIGESILVDGICLTVTHKMDSEIDVDVMIPTFEITTLRMKKINDRVHLEKALAIGERLNGHIVTGHVDILGIVEEISNEETTTFLTVGQLDPEAMQEIVEKGSISVDGVSLTVMDVSHNSFKVGLIPTTKTKTHLGALQVGDHVNLETDIIGKYVIQRSNNYGR
jgi:riboflavin synthase